MNELYNIFRKEEEKAINTRVERKEDNEEMKEKKEKESKFQIIKQKILLSNHFWEAILLSIEFCIENKIYSIFILDQYKEEIDDTFSHFEEIKK